MKLSTHREALLQPLSQVIGVVERRQTLPVLANFLLRAEGDRLQVTGTDLEVELIASCSADVQQAGEITVPARKLLDICRALPDGTEVHLSVDGEQANLKAGRGRFTLSTLPASEFPETDAVEVLQSFEVDADKLKTLIDKTAFSMANQDVRYYLNGLLLDFMEDGKLRAVATDGHRLSMSEFDGELAEATTRQVIVPRKGVMELQRMLNDQGDEATSLALGKSHIRLQKGHTRFTSKLIDGRFPDYQAVIPVGADKVIKVDRELFTNTLQRAAILSNEKYKGVRLEIADQAMKITAHNPQQEEAVEDIEVEHGFERLDIGFNVTYLLDALNALDSEEITLATRDANSSCVLRNPDNENTLHVVMPLKL